MSPFFGPRGVMLREGLYRRAGIGFQTIFTFGSRRCDRLVERVMGEIRRL